MKFEIIADIVKDIPFIRVDNAKYLYELIVNEKLANILELGFAHGTATCYMAAALDELGEGKITAVDLLAAKEVFMPSIEELLKKIKLEKYVNIQRMQTGYTWFLHDDIKAQTKKDICNTKYDLCIIDGPKNWTIDGFAFFLVDKLLKENGWIIFDDLIWTYRGANNSRTVTDGITHRTLSESELNTPHIKEIFELLVKQHTNYSELTVYPELNWGVARKRFSFKKNYTIKYEGLITDSIRKKYIKIKRKIKRSIKFFIK